MSKSPMEYSDERLRQAVALNPQGISLQTLVQAFGLADEKDQFILQAKLKALTDEGFAFKSSNNHYTAYKPLSDVVIGRVSDSLITGEHQINLSIVGMPDDFPFPVSLPMKQLKRFPELRVRKGSYLAVVVERHHGIALKARLLGPAGSGRPVSIVGHFRKESGGKGFAPYDPRIKTVFSIAGRTPQNPDPRTSYIASLPADYDPMNPHIHIGEQKWDPETGAKISAIIANKNGISVDHGSAARREAKKVIRWSPDITVRRDFRGEKILVVDPEDAKDHDDGILVERMMNGFSTLVAIADVPYYVRPGSALDAVAKARGFSHYFPDDVYPLLPPKLTEHASLIEGKEVPIIYVKQLWNEQGDPIGKPEIGLGMIESQQRMSYGELDHHTFSGSSRYGVYGEFGDIIIPKMRAEQGALILDEPSRNIRHETYSQYLVSNLMVSANASIAQWLDDNDVPFLKRAHSPYNNVDAYEEIRDKVAFLGYELPYDIADLTQDRVNNVLMEAARNGHREKSLVRSFIGSNLLRQALYTTRNFEHWGLHQPIYTHGTSPIRRYVDILTLRGVHTVEGDHECGLSEEDIEELERTSSQMNFLQGVARRLEIDAQKYYALRDLHRLEGHSVKGIIGRINEHGLEVVLDKHNGVSQVIPLNKLPPGWEVSRNRARLNYMDIPVSMGSPVRVRLGEIRPHRGEFDIAFVEGLPMKKPKKTAISEPQSRYPGPGARLA